MDLQHYLKRIPDLHSWDGGKTWNSGGFRAEHLRVFHDVIRQLDSPVIAETGAGNSTITFLLARPQKLISIAPDAALRDRITDFCETNGINTAPLEFFVDRSEIRLPLLHAGGGRLDLALIDGCHGWPSVFVDFCYLNAMLRKDGLIIVDDVQLHSVGELARLLKQEDGFKIERDLGKAIIFRKLDDECFMKEWAYQPYIKQRSK